MITCVIVFAVKAEQSRLAIARKTSVPKISRDDQENIQISWIQVTWLLKLIATQWLIERLLKTTGELGQYLSKLYVYVQGHFEEVLPLKVEVL